MKKTQNKTDACFIIYELQIAQIRLSHELTEMLKNPLGFELGWSRNEVSCT